MKIYPSPPSNKEVLIYSLMLLFTGVLCCFLLYKGYIDTQSRIDVPCTKEVHNAVAKNLAE